MKSRSLLRAGSHWVSLLCLMGMAASRPAAARLDGCVFHSRTNKLYYVVTAGGPPEDQEGGVQVTSVVLTGGTAVSLTETRLAGGQVLTAATGALFGDVLHGSGPDISAIKRTDVISGFGSIECSAFLFDSAGDGVLTLPGPVPRRLTFNGGAGGDPGGGVCSGATCLPLVPITMPSADTFPCANFGFACGIPGAVRTTFTRSIGMGSLTNAPTMVFPRAAGPLGPLQPSDAGVGEVNGQNVTLDDTQATRVGNSTSSVPSQPTLPVTDGFFLRRDCSSGCDVVVFAVDDGAPGYGVGAAGFAVDSLGRVLVSTGVQANAAFFPPSATPTPTATGTSTVTPTPTITPTSTRTPCVPNGAPCNDFNACTSGDHCDNSGLCVGGPPTACVPPDACSEFDSCDPVTGCKFHPKETQACGTCSDKIDNDGDGSTDLEDSGCSSMPDTQRFAVIAASADRFSRRNGLHVGKDVNVMSVAGTCPGSTAPFPLGPSRAGVCGHDMRIRSGATMGILASQYASGSKQRGLVFGDAEVGGRDISIRSQFVSNGAPEEILSMAPWVGPGTCEGNAAMVCSDNHDCPAAFPSCVGRYRLDQPNPHVDRTGTADNFKRCQAATKSIDAYGAAAALLPANVPGYTGGDVDLRTGRSKPLLTVNLGHGLQVLRVKALSVGRKTELRFVGFPDTIVVVRVGRKVRVGKSAKITLAGGLTADHLLWNVEGTKRRIVRLLRDAQFAGTLLAPQRRRIVVNAGARVDGALIAQRIRIRQETTVTHYPFVGLP